MAGKYNKRKTGYRAKNPNKKTSAENNRKDIQKMTREITSLKSQNAKQWLYAKYRSSFIDTNIEGPINLQLLNAPNNFSPLFTTGTNQGEYAKVYSSGFYMDLEINVGMEITSPITYTIFLLQPKPKCVELLDSDTGITQSKLIDGRHFTSVEGKAYINREYFNIWFSRHITLSAIAPGGGAVTNYSPTLKDLNRRFRCKIPFRNKYIATTGITNNWTILNEQNMPLSSRCYLAVFNSDTDADGTNGKYHVQTMHNIKMS